MTTTPTNTLEWFPSPRPGRDFEIRFECPEFTCLCPKTGQPDFATIRIRYTPNERCVELKSLKLYHQSFRNEGIFYEAVTNRMRDDLATAVQPKWMQVITEWKGRGGIHSRITATSGQVPPEWARG
jgi:7-cyano-7-deazaguanine reductase